MLNKHPNVFYPSRTAKNLLVHWQLLKQYYLLEDQSGEMLLNVTRSDNPACADRCHLISSDLFLVQPLPKGEQVLNFSDAEQVVDDAKLK